MWGRQVILRICVCLLTWVCCNCANARTSLVRGGDGYPNLRAVPKTDFSCKNRPVGYYADPEAKCQVYHVCDMKGNKFSYLCPNGTLFHQRHFVCAYHYQVDCSRATALYQLNGRMFPFKKFPRFLNKRVKTENAEEPQQSTSERHVLRRRQGDTPSGSFSSETQPQQESFVRTSRQLPPPKRSEIITWPRQLKPVPTRPPTIATTRTTTTTATTIPIETEFGIRISRPSPSTRNVLKQPRTTTLSSQFPLYEDEDSTERNLIQGSVNLDLMTIKFPKLPIKKFISSPVNPNCPQCNPYYLKNNQCTPCVVIR